jgi:Zn finger protein HypA/HybF involved in hydrogenase expression
MHYACSQEWLKKNVGCPLCRKTMLDETSKAMYQDFMDKLIKNNPFPNQSKQTIHCNDCGQKNEIDFHPLGRKCPDCGSYNTR